MQLLFNVDQAAALRKGIDAPASTVKLNVDPAELTPTEREILAAVVVDGHDCTKRGIQTAVDLGVYVGQNFSRRSGGDGINTYSDGKPTAALRLERPDLDGLRDAISRLLAEYHEKRAEAKRQADDWRQQGDANLREAMSDVGTKTVVVRLNEDGQPAGMDWHAVLSRKIEVPHLDGSDFDIKRASEDVRAEYLSLRELTKADADRWIAATVEDMQPVLRDLLARKAAEQAAGQEEYERLHSRLPRPLLERQEAGYATEDEIKEAIRDLIMKDAGLDEYAYDPASFKNLKSLTDEQFALLGEIQAEAPEGAEVEAVYAWHYRPATDDDDPEDIDDDGEVKVTGRYAHVRWERGGLVANAYVPLSDAGGGPQWESGE